MGGSIFWLSHFFTGVVTMASDEVFWMCFWLIASINVLWVVAFIVTLSKLGVCP